MGFSRGRPPLSLHTLLLRPWALAHAVTSAFYYLSFLLWLGECHREWSVSEAFPDIPGRGWGKVSCSDTNRSLTLFTLRCNERSPSSRKGPYRQTATLLLITSKPPSAHYFPVIHERTHRPAVPKLVLLQETTAYLANSGCMFSGSEGCQPRWTVFTSWLLLLFYLFLLLPDPLLYISRATWPGPSAAEDTQDVQVEVQRPAAHWAPGSCRPALSPGPQSPWVQGSLAVVLSERPVLDFYMFMLRQTVYMCES